MRSIIQQVYVFLILFICAIQTNQAQTKVQGVIIDSNYNNILRSVSVSVFEKGKDKVEKVTLTDQYGKFMIEDLVENKPYTIQFSYTGYQKIFRELLLSAKEQRNFGHIHMPFLANEIEAVEVIPPVRMNGDTLEFNADAFQLDTNAVIEDLLRKLPGLVVWGDGAVTYNGKEIPSILVNGKPFFGSDMSIALQNIQKEAVKTIQVYDARDQKEKVEAPDDQNYQMNVVLKEGKDKMYFGNVGAGVGNNDRYSGHLNFNISDKKRQGTVAYSTNNTNKQLNSVDQLLKNTTYKGVGINADFDSDFMRTGIQREHVLGARYQHDILGTNQVGQQHLIKGDILTTWRNNLNENNSATQLLSENDSEQNFRNYESINESAVNSQTGSFSYNNSVINLLDRSISINTNLYGTNSENVNSSNSFSDYQYTNNQSSNELANNSVNRDINLNFNTNINVSGKGVRNMYVMGDTKYTRWDRMTYTFGISANLQSSNSERLNQGDYINFQDAAKNKLTYRSYDSDLNGRRLRFTFSTQEQQSGISLRVNVNHYSTISSNMVVDRLNNTLVENIGLTHQSDFKQSIIEPTIEYNKALYNKNLYGRGYQSLYLSSSVGMKFYRDENRSSLDFRNMALNYNTFLPTISLRYNNSKSNVYHSSINTNYSYTEEYPYLDRMRPFYDDINPAYRNFGSVYQLRATGVHGINLSGNYSQTRQYGYRFYGNISYRKYIDGLTDSVMYGQDQLQVYTAQMDNPMNLFSGNLDVSKPYLIGKNQTLTANLLGNFSWGNKYQYLNTTLQEMLNNNQRISFDLYYTLVDKYMVGWKNSLNRYRRYNRLGDVVSNDYTSYVWDSGISMSYALTKRWSLNTNGTLRYNASGDFKDEVFIWNVNTTYRVLKGNNLEFKFAAYDLLRQNKGIYFSNGVTEFTTGYSNILTQYYMLSLSYFPRKFGFK